MKNDSDTLHERKEKPRFVPKLGFLGALCVCPTPTMRAATPVVFLKKKRNRKHHTSDSENIKDQGGFLLKVSKEEEKEVINYATWGNLL